MKQAYTVIRWAVSLSSAATPSCSRTRHPLAWTPMPAPSARRLLDFSNTRLAIPFLGACKSSAVIQHIFFFSFIRDREHVQNSKLRYNDDAMISFDIGHIYTLWIDTGTEM